MLKSVFTVAVVIFVGAVSLGAQDEESDSSDSTASRLDEFIDLLRDASNVFRVKLVRYGDLYRFEAVEWLKGERSGRPNEDKFRPSDETMDDAISSGSISREYLRVTGANDTSRHSGDILPFWSREFDISDGKIAITELDHPERVPLEAIRRFLKSVRPSASRDSHPDAVRAVPVSP